jgi:hypothetical protein
MPQGFRRNPDERRLARDLECSMRQRVALGAATATLASSGAVRLSSRLEV